MELMKKKNTLLRRAAPAALLWLSFCPVQAGSEAGPHESGEAGSPSQPATIALAKEGDADLAPNPSRRGDSTQNMPSTAHIPRPQEPPPSAAIPARKNAWWQARHEAKLREIAQSGAKIDLVFLGDSITQALERPESAKIVAEAFPGMTVLNLGYNADKTENVLWRLRNGEIDGLSPKAIVVMIGTNNSGHRMDPPEVTTRGIQMILDDLRAKMPDARIALLSIFPRGDAPHPNNQKINALLPALADGKTIFHIDINDAFLDASGQVPPDIMPDGLHPSVQGDALWIQALKPRLEQILAAPAGA